MIGTPRQMTDSPDRSLSDDKAEKSQGGGPFRLALHARASVVATVALETVGPTTLSRMPANRQRQISRRQHPVFHALHRRPLKVTYNLSTTSTASFN